jgi:hypothetical protein
MSAMSIGKITSHFEWADVTHSEEAIEHGIDNRLPLDLIDTAINTARGMERVRGIVDYPITVNSWYRCPTLNTLVGSKSTSQHLKGEAVDWVSHEAGTPVELCKLLIPYQDFLGYDQLILEHTWIHISFPSNPTAIPKKQVLSLLESGGYASGLTDNKGNPL